MAYWWLNLCVLNFFQFLTLPFRVISLHKCLTATILNRAFLKFDCIMCALIGLVSGVMQRERIVFKMK